MISFDALQAGYGPRAVLKGVSATAEKGELIALIGPQWMWKVYLAQDALRYFYPDFRIYKLGRENSYILDLKRAR